MMSVKADRGARLGRLLVTAVTILVIGLSMGVAYASFPPGDTASLSLGAEQDSRVNLPQMEVTAPLDTVAPGGAARPGSILYEQYDFVSSRGVSSQNFEPISDTFDSQLADDFMVPQGRTWSVDTVEVSGAYHGSGPAASVNVYFYASAGELPGAPVVTRTNIIFTPGPAYGDLNIPLSPPVVLPAGNYWLSVQANQDFRTQGQWFWRGRQVISNYSAAWRNPGRGFRGDGELCNNWGSLTCSCGAWPGHDPDAIFRLSGTTGGTPTPGTTATALPMNTAGPPTATPTGIPGIPTPVLTIAPPLEPTNSPPPVPLCGLAWRVVSSPNQESVINQLYDVTAIGANEAWAVGQYGDPYSASRALIERWNGTSWSIVPGATSQNNHSLNGVHGQASNDVWAVGSYSIYNVKRTLIERWDGTQWRIVPSPNGGQSTDDNELLDIAALSASDAWAVGYHVVSGGGSRTLIMRWNGQDWNVIPSPNPGSYLNRLEAVSASGPNDVWAVGTTGDMYYGNEQVLVLHWDGSAWTVVPGITDPGWLYDVAALPGGEVWAVGTTRTQCVQQALVLRRSGEQTAAFVPFPMPGSPTLKGVAIVSPNDVWVVGDQFLRGDQRTLTAHWEGSAWTVVSSPNFPSYYQDLSRLEGVAALSSQSVIAVGTYFDVHVGELQTLTLRYSDPCVLTPTVVPTATVPTTAIPTTAVPTTAVPTSPTPTACTISFSDVPVGHTFYDNVRCLACRRIVSGYQDNTFRPNNDVTRGQLAKIVSNAAGFSEDPGPQIFTDVPSGSTFYEWVNRLTRRGYMSGYACGGPGEPCVEGRPYFRPSANATRGQTSKIVSNTAGYTEEPAAQTFQDVPSTHTFYKEIERLASRGVMGGYACGGPGEPCTTGRPYFRPQNNVTRGQSAKIVANTFHPGCSTP